MLYLASRFVWFLLAAFVLGGAMGWVGRSGGERRVWSGAWTWLAVLWCLGAVLAWFQFVNGVPAAWLETALLFVAVYWLGCVSGALASFFAASRPQAAPVLAVEKPAPARIDPVLVPPAAAAMPPVENEASYPGRRPAGLAAARDAKADDLKRIKGIGRQNELRLHELGIWHFEQIAGWTPENIEWVGGYLAFPGRIEREDWVGQAKTLSGDRTLENAKPGSGDIPAVDIAAGGKS